MTTVTPRKIMLLQVIFIAILGCSVYANSLKGEFIWDDAALIRDNMYIKEVPRFAHIFKKDIGAGVFAEFGFYRPLQIATYIFDYSVWKLNVAGYHLTNILLHILVALAIYWFTILLFQRPPLSLLTSLFFIAHPMHSEAVAYISGRADILSALFMLLCLIFYVKRNSSKSHASWLFVSMVLSYICALLSKEYSLITPVFLLAYSYVFQKKLQSKDILSVCGISFFYILLRMALKIYPADLHTSTVFQRIPGIFVALSEYLRLLLMPFHLHMEYGSRLFSFVNPKAILGMLILLVSLLYCLRKNPSRLKLFSLSWFFIAVLPVSNLYPINAFMAEHWLYLPSLGFFLILSDSLLELKSRKGTKYVASALMTAFLFFYSFLTIKQNNYWRNKESFYSRTLKYAPDSPKIYNNFCKAYIDMGKNDEAIPLCKKAIEIRPKFAAAYQNLGNAYKNMGDRTEALKAYKKAIEISPKDARTYNNMAVLYNDMGDIPKALELYKKAIEINPRYAEAHYNLGNAYSSMRNFDEAIACFRKAIEVDPNSIHGDAYYNNLAAMHALKGDREEAILLYEKAIRINPGSAILRENLNRLKQEEVRRVLR